MIIKKDFIEDSKCNFCPQKITTKVAYIIELDNGQIKQCGPKCFKKHFNEITYILDFTRASLEFVSKKLNASNNKNNIIKNINDTKEIEYLYLRCELLNDFKGVEFPLLMDIYKKNKYLLNDNDKNYIKNLMNKLKFSNLNYKNLMACYMTKRILNMWIKKENNEFAKGIYEYLKKNCSLTEKQIIGANNWIENMKNIPKIKGNWFYGIDKRNNGT